MVPPDVRDGAAYQMLSVRQKKQIKQEVGDFF
jgi:hypothetical protein